MVLLPAHCGDSMAVRLQTTAIAAATPSAVSTTVPFRQVLRKTPPSSIEVY